MAGRGKSLFYESQFRHWMDGLRSDNTLEFYMNLMSKIASSLLCWLASFQICNAGLPTTEAVGKLLGYSSSELLIEDTTVQERTLVQIPSRREQKRQTVLPDPAVLLKAYVIRGKNESSFFPLQIYIGVKGVFLTSEVLDQFTKSVATVNPLKSSETEQFESLGRWGGFFTQFHKVKSETPPVNIPRLVAAAITVVQPHGQEFDIKIAQRADLGRGQDLQPLPGGEAYYNTFGPSSDQKTEPRLDTAKILFDLNKIVIAAWLAEKGSYGISPPIQPLSTQQTTSSNQPVVTPRIEPASAPSSSARRWWLGGLALVVLAFIANALRKHLR
jgi:hypothetical protein